MCFICPTGAECPGGSTVFADPGYYVANLPKKHEFEAYPCLPHVCAGGSPASVNQCTEPRSGVLCASCPSGYTTVLSHGDAPVCLQCDGVHVGVVLLLVACLLVLSIYLHVSVMGDSSKLKITFYFLQIALLNLPVASQTYDFNL